MAPAPGVGAQVTRNPAGPVLRRGFFFVLRPKSLQNSQPRAACSSNAEYEYVRVQNDDGLAMEAPITVRRLNRGHRVCGVVSTATSADVRDQTSGVSYQPLQPHVQAKSLTPDP